MNGIDVTYSLNPDYFEVGCAYKMCLGTNDYRIGILVKYSSNEVVFKVLNKEKSELIDLYLTTDDLRFKSYDLIKMQPDYKDGIFESE